MFYEAELNLTFSAIPNVDDLGVLVARGVELGLVVTGAGRDGQVSGRYAVGFASGAGRKAQEVQRIFEKVMEVAESIKG